MSVLHPAWPGKDHQAEYAVSHQAVVMMRSSWTSSRGQAEGLRKRGALKKGGPNVMWLTAAAAP